MDSDSRHASAPTNIRAMFRALASPHDLPLFADAVNSLNQDEPALPQGHGMHEAVALFLEDMNRKLDQVIALLTTNRLEEDFPFQAQVTEISGAWAVLQTLEPLKQGDSVEMVFVLSRMPLSLAGAVGRVESAAVLENATRAKIGFTSIRQPDQESLVQFVFHEQRQQIRAAKWE